MRTPAASRSVLQPANRYRTQTADGLLDVAGVVVHNGSPSSSGQDATTGLHGLQQYSYPETIIPLVAAAGFRWVRHDILPGNGAGSLDAFRWTGSAVTAAAAANDRVMFGLYKANGLSAMVGVSDSRSLGQLQAYATPGGIFSQVGWWPGIIESINEDFNFLAYPYGTSRGAWSASHGAYAVGDVVSGIQQGGSWYCIQAHTATSSNGPNDTVTGQGNFMPAPNPNWVPQWAYEQLTISQATKALRNSTAAMAGTLIADGGSASNAYLPTLIYASQSMGLGGSLGADLFNVHDYANPGWAAVREQAGLPSLAPIGPQATTLGKVVLGETGLQVGATDFGSGNNMVRAFIEGYRLGFAKVFGYHFLDDTGVYPATIPVGVNDYGLVTATPATAMPYTGNPAAFPITAKPGYTMIKNLFAVIADPGTQPPARIVDLHFTGPGNLVPVFPVMQRRNGQIDLAVFITPDYNGPGRGNSPATADQACTIVLDSFTASLFQLYDPTTNTWTSSASGAGQTSWALNPGITNYPRLLRITPG